MGFVQVIKLSTKDFAALEAAHETWLEATHGERTVSRVMVCANRDKADEYWLIVEFPSYEDAMRNNDLPATAVIGAKLAEVSGGQLEFTNLELQRVD